MKYNLLNVRRRHYMNKNYKFAEDNNVIYESEIPPTVEELQLSNLLMIEAIKEFKQVKKTNSSERSPATL